MDKKPNILVFGAGAIGASVGAWIASRYEPICFFDKGPVAQALKSKGITHYREGRKNKAETVKVKLVDDLADAPRPDIIIIAVKIYSLDAVAGMLKDRFGDDPVIVALQNGIENQNIMPKYFSRVIYGVVGYNAWLDEPGVVGYQKRGPVIIGTVANDLSAELKTVSRIFNMGVETIVTGHLQDAARSKMIINLTNSLTTLVGHRYREISDMDLFQKLLTNLLREGVKIIRAAGYKECRLGGMPSWLLIQAGAELPRFLTRKMFEDNVKKMVLSSMAQDIIQRKGAESELEFLNGYFVKLADEFGVKAPYNRAVYRLCKERFGGPDFEPMDVKEVWARVKEIKKQLKEK